MNAPIRPLSPENASPQQIYRAILATDFRAFVDYVFGLLRPGIPFKPNWHIDAMAHKVSQVASGEVKRLIITVPPRNLKSIIASVALPAWYLGHNPSERVVCVSYSAELAKTHSNDFRRVVTDPVYQAVFPKMILSRETDSEIHTTLRGRRYTRVQSDAARRQQVTGTRSRSRSPKHRRNRAAAVWPGIRLHIDPVREVRPPRREGGKLVGHKNLSDGGAKKMIDIALRREGK
jgi:hypothetical protein